MRKDSHRSFSEAYGHLLLYTHFHRANRIDLTRFVANISVPLFLNFSRDVVPRRSCHYRRANFHILVSMYPVLSVSSVLELSKVCSLNSLTEEISFVLRGATLCKNTELSKVANDASFLTQHVKRITRTVEDQTAIYRSCRFCLLTKNGSSSFHSLRSTYSYDNVTQNHGRILAKVTRAIK